MRRAPKWPGSNQWRKYADWDGREVRSRVEARANRIAGKRPLHDRVQVGVSATSDEISPEPVFELYLRSLGSERLGIDRGSKLECSGYGWWDAEINQPLHRNKLNQMAELIVKIGESKFCPPIEKGLLKAAVVGAGALGSNGSNVELRNKLCSIADLRRLK